MNEPLSPLRNAIHEAIERIVENELRGVPSWRIDLTNRLTNVAVAAARRASDAQVAGLREALRSVGWNERDGLCWCRETPDIGLDKPLKDHEPRCLEARVALAAAPAPQPATPPLDVEPVLAVARHFDEDAFACDFGGVTSVNLPNLEVVIPLAEPRS